MIFSLIISAIVFGCATYLALEVASAIFAGDGIALKGSPDTMMLMRVLFPVASGMLGAMLASYSADWLTFLTVGIVCSALAMATWSALGYGNVPDAVLVVPLIVVLGTALLGKQWGQVAAALFLASPFVVLMIVTKGKGAARTDIELAAVAGAMLGLEYGVLASGLALAIAFVVNYRNRSEKKPIELTPYMAGSIVVALLVRLVLPTNVA